MPTLPTPSSCNYTRPVELGPSYILHRLRWHGDNTPGTTALVHEAYLKLVDQGLAFLRDVMKVGLGESDRTLDALEAACDARVKNLRLLRIEPLVDPLHGEPRFQSLLAGVGLADDEVARAHVS